MPLYKEVSFLASSTLLREGRRFQSTHNYALLKFSIAKPCLKIDFGVIFVLRNICESRGFEFHTWRRNATYKVFGTSHPRIQELVYDKGGVSPATVRPAHPGGAEFLPPALPAAVALPARRRAELPLWVGELMYKGYSPRVARLLAPTHGTSVCLRLPKEKPATPPVQPTVPSHPPIRVVKGPIKLQHHFTAVGHKFC